MRLTKNQKHAIDQFILWTERFLIVVLALPMLAYCLYGCHVHLHMGEKHFHDTQKTNTQEGIVLSFPDEEEQGQDNDD